MLFEPEDSLYLAIIDVFLELDYVGVQLLDVVNIGENEGFVGVEPKRKDIANVILAHLIGSFRPIQLNLLLVQILLVVSDLNDQGHVEGFL